MCRTMDSDMNVERTIEFILQQQARTEAILARAAERQARADARQDRADARQDRAEKSMQGIRTILKIGMRKMVEVAAIQKAVGQAQKRTEVNLNRLEGKIERLAELQHHTDKSLNRLIQSLHGPSGNGRKGTAH